MVGALIRLCRGSRSPGRDTWSRLGDDRWRKWAEFRSVCKGKPGKGKERAFQEEGADSMSKGVGKQIAWHV